MPDTARQLTLARPVSRRRPARRTARVAITDGELEVACRTHGAWAAFELLRRRGASGAELAATAAAGGPAAAREWRVLRRRLERHGAVGTRLVMADGTWLCTVHPMQGGAPVAPMPRGRVMLSQFAYVRRAGHGWELRSPLSRDRLDVSPMVLGLLARLDSPQTASSLARVAGCRREVAREVLAVLGASGLLTRVRADGRTAEALEPTLAQWEFPDLVLQAHHRLGRHDGVVGAAYPFLDDVQPEPATVRLRGHRTIALARPDTARLVREDEPLASVMERRRSIREYGVVPLHATALGELLWRCARVRATLPPERGRPYTVTNRPYPSGGGAYPLEIFVTVGRCRGLTRGLYHYDPVAHALTSLGPHRETVTALLDDARISQGRTGGAQVLLTFVARFRRLTWKYRSIALATILKDVGSLTQTLYLAATAMGLAPCGIGSGDAMRLARAIGWDFADASAVGDLLLGSAPPRAR